jgi:antitoxin PrlF
MTLEKIMPTPAVRVQEKGQVTIPVEIRQKLNLKKGDLVTFVETEEGVMIKPAEVIVSEALDEIGKALKEKGISLEDLLERGREIRGQIVEEEYGITGSKSK